MTEARQAWGERPPRVAPSLLVSGQKPPPPLFPGGNGGRLRAVAHGALLAVSSWQTMQPKHFFVTCMLFHVAALHLHANAC